MYTHLKHMMQSIHCHIHFMNIVNIFLLLKRVELNIKLGLEILTSIKLVKSSIFLRKSLDSFNLATLLAG